MTDDTVDVTGAMVNGFKDGLTVEAIGVGAMTVFQLGA
jgi:hypothetical protein